MPKPKQQSKDNAATDADAQLQELTQALQRERADAVNLRRRHEVEITGLRTQVKASVIQQLLPVIDNFERALKHVPNDLLDNDYVKGIRAIAKQFEQTLEQMGIARIKTVGEHFDPHLHEAVGLEESGGKHQIISEELQAGYLLGDQVIRHAMVKVRS